ncbi:hypothetical protein [Tenacibaculum soleae]|uniref:hypothetical protein n=1 Tax=Tenacibaculum soleae TaxID=447689 RepID=UPI002301DF0C|nr:hypothetical protein [Tenacibaculum soleae]
MKFEKIKALVYGYLNIDAANKEPLNLTAEQKSTLDAQVKKEGFAEKFEARHNEAIEAEKDNQEAISQIDAFMEESGDGAAASEDPNEAPSADDGADKSLSAKVTGLTASLKAERTARLKAEQTVNKLKGVAEADNPETIHGNLKQTMQHSTTHLNATNNSWDAFEGRSWNQLAAGLPGAAATNWNTANIDKLNTDIQDYFRKDPKKLHSTFMDGLELPKYWKLISGVSDEYIFTTISTGEITQGLKIKWLPKNNASFSAQKGKVRDIQIDIEFKGDELKKLEKSYLNNFFNEGSTPFKDGFILYVVKELMKQARKEDKIVIGKGVYFPNENAETPGSFLNNFSGVIKLITDARDVFFKSFKLGKPTDLNVHGYVDNFVKKLPHDIRILPGLVFYMSPTWLKSYNEARRREKGRDQDFSGGIMHVDGYANIEILAYDQLEGYDLFFLTTEDNISILTDKPGENGVLSFQKDVRNTRALGDYKLGTFIAMFGRKLIGKTSTYENQLFFSNDVEVLTDVYVPVEKNNATPSLKWHNSLMVGANNTSATNITDFTDAQINSRIYLLGNADENYSTVKNNAKISLLNNDCVLEKGKLLVLYVKLDGTFQELYREDTAVTELEEATVVLENDVTMIDASVGTRFATQSNTQATTINSITNAIDGETYRIEGAGTRNATTIANSGIFALSAEMTLSDGKFIELYYNGSKFIETARG